jgi:hypothetical protein
MMIPVPPAKALLVNPEALPVGELAVLVLDELGVLLDLLLEPQAVSTAAAITAAATRLAVDARARRGFFKREDFMGGSAPFGGEGRVSGTCTRNEGRSYPRHSPRLWPGCERRLGEAPASPTESADRNVEIRN